jgi:hypothetical protein
MRRYGAIVGLILVTSLASGVANAAILNGSQTTNAGQNMTIDLTIDTILDTVAITMTGPEAVWFAVAFEPLAHPSGANDYSVVPLGGASAPDVQEWALGSFSAGVLLADSLSVDSNTVSAGVRTTELSGLQAGANYTYPTIPTTMDISWAYGNGADFALHADRGETTLALVEVVPEPSSVILFGMGLSAIGIMRTRGNLRRKLKNATIM